MSVVSVSLRRDGPGTAWGFRLQGGRDVGCPLTIQRVFLGSPSEGEIQRGDVLLQINNKDAGKLSHMEAHDIIKHAGNNLNLVVHRSGIASSPGITPTTPPFKPTGHPLANVKPLPSSGIKPGIPSAPKLFQPVAPQPSQNSNLPWVKQPGYVPPPTSAKIPTFFPTPQNFVEVEEQEFYKENTREKQAIVNQAYRTFPLISPHAKPRHDLPTGSYLRHVQDPNWRQSPTRAPQVNRVVMQTPSQGPQVVHSQYNSPINLYSNQNVAETYAEQTGMQPGTMRPAAKKFTTQQSQTSSPAAKGGEKMSSIVDITKSPTYQMIQEQESKMSPKPEVDEAPRSTPQKRMYIHPIQCNEDHSLNAFGVPRDKILQSGSFKSLMTIINTQSDF
ncbi:LIM domain-binding protein 3-like isoform X2 [Centruroides sculpturatus]|uniref:LIM domain-binding protein 3-like isoform X2 n=1 Tax=Centruroides sculpturatus TaxID=218467 RepID=UPI000C6E945B|nr:LIM domain-binding protein 3-like isoform X2 [Centruroides sculpturatus]